MKESGKGVVKEKESEIEGVVTELVNSVDNLSESVAEFIQMLDPVLSSEDQSKDEATKPELQSSTPLGRRLETQKDRISNTVNQIRDTIQRTKL